MADDQAYLDELKEKRASMVGVKALAFSDQQITTDLESLDREIARVEFALNSSTRRNYRLAATSKGV